MMEFISQLQEQLGQQLLMAEHETISVLHQAERSVSIIEHSLNKLREFILGHAFKDEKEEIHFFKQVKPQIYSKLIYFLRIFHIETRRPKACKELQRELLQSEMKMIKDFFDQNLDFYQYYSSNATFLDHEYFIRGKNNLRLSLDEYSMLIDASFCTTHSYKISRILAYESLQPHLLRSLDELDRKEEPHTPSGVAKQINARTSLNWQANKVALAELCYAIYSHGAIAPATTDVKKIADILSQVFNMPLDNIYKMYEEMRLRKKNRTPFLHALIQSLNRKMDYDDEHSS